MKNYNVIFITYLKLVTNSTEDFYLHYRLSIFIVIIEGEEKYEIEKLLKKRNIHRGRD